MAEGELQLFSDDLPYRLPVWHSVQSSNKKFSIANNQFDLDIVPDYGGHMLDYDKRTDRFTSIKHDCLGKSPFVVKSHWTPLKVSLESTGRLPNDARVDECLAYDQRLNLLISTLSYDHPRQKQFIIRRIDRKADQIDDDANTLKQNLQFKEGNIQQVNRFVHTGVKHLTHVRQERCLSVFEFRGNAKEHLTADHLVKTSKFLLEDPNESNFHSDHNSRLFNCLLSGSVVGNVVKLKELDLERTARIWSTSFEFVEDDRPLQVKYSESHPKMFNYLTLNEVKLFDTRFTTAGSLKFSKTSLSSVGQIESFRRISNCHSNPNHLLLASDFSLMLLDIRYPNCVLLQWNHMLSSDTNVCFLQSLQLEKESIFTANREQVCAVSIDKPTNGCLVQPTSLHFPIHLPRLKNLVRCSSVVDLRLDEYIAGAQVVGLDFAVGDGQDFEVYSMTQHGDIFRQSLSKTRLVNSDEQVLQYEPNSKQVLDRRLAFFKDELLKKRRTEAKNEDFFDLTKERRTNTLKRPKDRTYWAKFANNLELSADELGRQRMEDPVEELGGF